MTNKDIIPGATYYLKLVANANDPLPAAGAHFTTVPPAGEGIGIYFGNAVIAAMLDDLATPQEASEPRTCGECAHLRHLDPKKDSYNREAYAKRPWGDCHIYERSPEYQRMVENHFHGCGWRYAPGRAFDQPACQHFTPKKP